MLPSEYILAEHVRLGSQSVILSRTFKGIEGVDENARKIDLTEEVEKVRSRVREIESWNDYQFQDNIRKIKAAVEQVVIKMQSKTAL